MAVRSSHCIEISQNDSCVIIVLLILGNPVALENPENPNATKSDEKNQTESSMLLNAANPHPPPTSDTFVMSQD